MLFRSEALARMRELQAGMQQALAGLEQGVDRQRSAEDVALQKLAGDVRRAIARAQAGEERLRDDLRPAADEQTRATEEHLRSAKNSVVPAVEALFKEAGDLLRPQRLATSEMRGHRGVGGARDAVQTASTTLEQGQYEDRKSTRLNSSH